jgi:hypothetical protein
MRRALLLVLAALGVAVPAVNASGADFMATSTSSGNAFAAAADFNTVTVALTNPGTPVSGAIALAATAGSERGIADVRFQVAAAGTAAWTDICTDAAAPYACSWDSSSVANGSYDLRALARDTAGYSRGAAVAALVVDNIGPTVTLQDPGAWLQGSATIAATASDTGTGVASLGLQYRAAGATPWTDLCTGGGTSRSCPLDTTSLPDGDLELRAVAADAAGNSRATAPLTRRVDNNAPTVAMTDPGVLRGAVSLGATAGDGAGTGVVSVTGQYRANGTATWTTACVDTTAPYSCTIDTTGANGLFDLRVTAVDGTGRSTVSAVLTRMVDNTAPATATLANLAATLQGTVAATGTATDAGSGIASWTVQYRTAGAGAWTTACADSASPYGCSWNTTGVADGLYDVRALATDGGGLTTASTIQANRRVDNLGPTVTLADPGAALRGTVALTATATDPAGMTSVVFERKPSAGSTWTTICTDTTTPWTCSWNTVGLADGIYDLRARAIDALGHTSTSTVTARQVDNTAPAPADVQAGNGGATAGRPEANDWLAFTWSETLSPASVRTGWNGSALAVIVSFANAGAADTLTIAPASGGGTVNILGAPLSLNANLVTAATSFNATMVQTGATITVTLGTRISGTVTTGAAKAMSWTASAAAADAAGNPSATAVVTEPGALDADF